MSRNFRRTKFGHSLRRDVIHPALGLLVHCLYYFGSILPVDFSSNLGGRLGRWLGPKIGHKSHRRAQKNLRLCFPEKSENEIEVILGNMWEHLGRVGGEFPVLAKIIRQKRITIVDQHLIADDWTDGKPTIFFSGHMGNWELAPALGQEWKIDMVAIYQPPTNRFIDRLTKKVRKELGLTIVPRGPESIDKVFRKLKDGGSLAILADQRRTSGEWVSFFGQPARTLVTLGQIAMRFNCQVYPVRIVRTQGANFELRCYPPFEFEPTGDRKKDSVVYMERVNELYENWIREVPEQWLWPHRRWR
jgi:Kdo2-lipid IVA lauroyltransferase/acyltransferase